MILYLVRHALPNPKEVDPELSLSSDGIIEIKKTASYAANHKVGVISKIMHSGKTRARQTAEILAQHLSPSSKILTTDSLKPLDNPKIWQRRLENFNEDIALVGHLPFLSNLANLLLGDDNSSYGTQFPTAAIACLHRDDSTLHWELKWTIQPDAIP